MEIWALEGGVGGRDEDLEVSLEPSTSLGSGLHGIRKTASRVVTRRRCIRSAITFTSGLDPYDSIDVRVTGGGGGAHTEAGSLDVAPVTPLNTDVLDTGATLIDDEVGGEARGCEHGAQGVDVVDLVVVGVAGGDRIRAGSGESVVVGDVYKT